VSAVLGSIRSDDSLEGDPIEVIASMKRFSSTGDDMYRSESVVERRLGGGVTRCRLSSVTDPPSTDSLDSDPGGRGVFKKKLSLEYDPVGGVLRKELSELYLHEDQEAEPVLQHWLQLLLVGRRFMS